MRRSCPSESDDCIHIESLLTTSLERTAITLANSKTRRRNNSSVLLHNSDSTPLSSPQPFFLTPTPFKAVKNETGGDTGAISAEYRTKMNKMINESNNSLALFPEEFNHSPAAHVRSDIWQKDVSISIEEFYERNKRTAVCFVPSLKQVSTRTTQSTLTEKYIMLNCKKQDKIFEMKTEACRYLHSGLFKKAIEIGLSCLHKINSYQTTGSKSLDQIYPTMNYDVIYIKLLLGQAYTHCNLFDLAYEQLASVKKQLEQNLQFSSGSIPTELLKRGRYDPDMLAFCIICYDDLANLRRLQKEFYQALQLYNNVQILKTIVHGEQSISVASGYHNLGITFMNMGEYDKALLMFQRSKDIRSHILGADHIEIATVYNNIGSVYMYVGNFQQALASLSKGKTILETISTSTKDEFSHPDLATCYINIATSLKHLSRYQDALEYYENAQTLREKILGIDHPNTISCCMLIGSLYIEMNNMDRSLEYLLHAKQQLAILVQKKTNEACLEQRTLLDAARVSCALGSIYCKIKKYDLAIKEYTISREIYSRVFGNSCIENLQIDESVSSIYISLGLTNEALKLLQSITKHWKGVHGEFHPYIAMVYNNIGTVYKMQGRYDEAFQMFDKARSIFEREYGFEHEATATVYTNLGQLHLNDKRRVDTAITLLSQALTIRKQLYGEHSVQTAECMKNLAVAHRELKRYDMAYKYGILCKDQIEKLVGRDHADYREMDKFIAGILREKSKDIVLPITTNNSRRHTQFKNQTN